MKLSLWEIDRKQKAERLATYALGAITLLNILTGTVLLNIFASNIMLEPFVTYLGAIIDLSSFAFYWTSLAFFIYISSRYSLKACKNLFLIYASCVVCRSILSIGIGCLLLMEAPEWNDLWQILFEIFMDAIQMAVASLLVYFFFEKKGSDEQPIRHFNQKLFDFSDRFLRCVLLISLIPSILKLISRIRYDIFLGVPASTANLMAMILGYLFDLICALLGYLLIYWILTQLVIQDKEAEFKRKQEEQAEDLL